MPGTRRLRRARRARLRRATSLRLPVQPAARTSSPPRAQARGRLRAAASPSHWRNGVPRVRTSGVETRSPERHLLAVARARPRDPLVVSLRQPAARRQRPRARGRPQPLDDASLHLDARRARLPAAGPGVAQVPARAARARPRVLGDQLDGPARGRRAAPAAAERRDRPHRQHGGARRRRHRLHRALPHLAARPARHRPEPAHRLAAPRVLHLDGQGAARRARARAAARGARARCSSRSAGPNALTDLDELLAELERVRSRRPRRQQRRARLRPALDRRARAVADRRGRRGDQPRRAQDDGLARLARRAPRPAAEAHRRRDLGAHRLPASRS